MKRLLIVVISAVALLILICASACIAAVTVENTYIDDNMHLIIEYSNGTTKDLGYVGVSTGAGTLSVKDTYVDDKLHLIVEYSDGTTKDLGYVGVSTEDSALGVKNTYVNDDLHLIVEYFDGTTKDLGYVGVDVQVEVEPPLYTVTFLDINGNILDVQEVYKGRGAKAPSAPAVADKVFAGWNKDITNIQSDITVTAVYTDADRYTVTFKDELGNVLKTQVVIFGHSADAPIPPTRELTVFTGWDKSFSNVYGDMTVTAQYRQKYNYTVTFMDYSGLFLGAVGVKEGDSATAPLTPARDGYSFSGWSEPLTNITSNKTVTAQYEPKGGNNVFDISYALGSNNTVTVTCAVKGSVKFCGLEGSMVVPNALTYVSHNEGNGALANYVANDGKVYFTMTSNNGQNLTSATTVVTITFKYSSDATIISLDTALTEFFDQTGASVNYNIIGQDIKVK